jgi:APA family basic amino acid/polyamine antiporter
MSTVEPARPGEGTGGVAAGPDDRAPRRLRRELGTGGAVLLGLGSILGTGVFVSIGVAAGVAGPAVVLAVAVASLVAAANGLSSAQLAANHPVSGGTYEYGYRYLNPALGFTAGWMFLAAKSASAATAALGFAGYLLALAAGAGWIGPAGTAGGVRVATAVGAVAALTLVVVGGVRRSNRLNAVIVVVALGSLAFFVAAGAPVALGRGGAGFAPFIQPAGGRGPLAAVAYATALMFVAYTGYGRIATLGEEVRDPRRSIPRAIVVTLLVTLVLYMAVAAVGVGAVGAAGFARGAGESAAPLELAARSFPLGFAPGVLAVGALVALVGVLLNLILGLSRVLLAMGRRGDVPHLFAGLDEEATTPTAAVVAVGGLIAALALLGDVETTWSFSAFTVLIYYALTNLAALRLPAADRLYPPWIAWAGLAGCLGLAFWVDPVVWAAGLGLIAAGLGWHAVARRLARG